MRKYFEDWENREDVAREFFYNCWDDEGNYVIPDDFPSEEEILFAYYGREYYTGSAFVLFQRNGKLYEVNGSHCSCYGLENQWEPEETSWDALAMRKWDWIFYYSDEEIYDSENEEYERHRAALKTLKFLIEENTSEVT